MLRQRVNQATYTRILFFSAFINNQCYMRNVLSEKVSTKKNLSHILDISVRNISHETNS